MSRRIEQYPFGVDIMVRPQDVASPQDMTTAVGTVLGTWDMPADWDSGADILTIGFTLNAAGTSVATKGAIKLAIDGTDVTMVGNAAANTVPTAVHPGTTGTVGQSVEQDLNGNTFGNPGVTATSLTNVALTAPPAFPQMVGALDVSGRTTQNNLGEGLAVLTQSKRLQWKVAVQGVGGTQTIFPYAILRRRAVPNANP